MTESTTIHLLLASLLVAVAIAHFALRVRAPHSISVSDVTIWMTALQFGLFPWLVFTTARDLPYQDPMVILKVYFAIATFLLIIQAVATFARKVFPSRDVVPPGVVASRLWITSAGSTSTPLLLFLSLYSVTVGLRLFVGMYYGMFLSGERFAQDMPAWVGISLYVAEVFKYGAFLWAAATLSSTSKNRLIAGLILLVEFGLSFGIGRRWLVADIIIFLITYLMFVGFKKKTFAYSLVGILILVISVSLFQRVRYYRWIHPEGKGLAGYISAVSDAVSDVDQTRRAESENANFGERPLEMEGFLMLIAKTQADRPELPTMHGEAMQASIVYALPYYLFPEKRDWLLPENAVKRHYGLNEKKDMGSCWLAYGIADFGMFGGFYVGAIFGITIVLAEGFARFLSPKFPYLAAGIVGTMLMYACQVQELPSEVFASLRNDLALGLLCVVIMPFVKPRWLSHGNQVEFPEAGEEVTESPNNEIVDAAWPQEAGDFG